MAVHICSSCRRALIRRINPRQSPLAVRYSSRGALPEDVSSALAHPTWSVRSLLPSSDDAVDAPQVTPEQLRHLCRLSALPPPRNKDEESKMLRDLTTQLHFVKHIQSVDTTGVEPLRNLRDETTHGRKENTIGVEEMQEELDKEESVGPLGRIRRKTGLSPAQQEQSRQAMAWDVLGQAEERVGRYFVVKKKPKGEESKQGPEGE